MNAKAQKYKQLDQIKVSRDERTSRQRGKISERGLKKEKLLRVSSRTASGDVETMQDMEVESIVSHETEGEDSDMLHETESERLKGKFSDDELMKSDHESISGRETERDSSKNLDGSNENFKARENVKYNFADAESNFTPDDTKDSDIESDKTDERDGK